MIRKIHQLSFVSGLIAAVSLTAAPAAAADAPRLVPVAASSFTASTFNTSTIKPGVDVAQWGGWGGGWRGGWGRGWGRGWGGRGWRRRGPSAGEVLAGVAIIGGIAAIASAASNNRRNRDVVVVDRDRPRDWNRDWNSDPNFRDVDRRANPRSSGASGLDSAVNQCLTTIERDVRVGEVQVVQRTAQGWLVGGTLFNGSGFECRIGNDGRIEGVDYGRGGPLGAADSGPAPGGAGQWDDRRYAAARLAAGPAQPSPEGGIEMFTPPPSAVAVASGQPQSESGAQPLVPLTARRRPSYPGGPVEGEQPAPLVQRPGIP